MRGGHEYPEGINTPCKKALYDNLNKDEEVVNLVYTAAKANAEIGWRESKPRWKKLSKAIDKVLPEGCDLDKFMNILKNQEEI